jgi:hypothetical protein
MKNIKLIINSRFQLILVLGVLSLLILSSCEKEEIINESLASKIIGTYTGTLKNSTTNQSRQATFTVNMLNDSLVSMHCIGNGFDSTVVMQLYQNYDSIMVCFTGQDFYNEYGHNKNNYDFCSSKKAGWMNNVWMNDGNCWGNYNSNWGNNSWAGNEQWNAWTNHINTQHNQNDTHFGGFNPALNSFNCNFLVHNGSINYFEVFDGVRNN